MSEGKAITLKRCSHVHVSGRRCGSRTTDKTEQQCILHRSRVHGGKATCSECSDMMAAFTPPKGWHLQ